jgi:hypothetical protein
MDKIKLFESLAKILDSTNISSKLRKTIEDELRKLYNELGDNDYIITIINRLNKKNI